MSILIKGIDIPKCCNECTLKYDIKCKCYIGYHHKDTNRANKCPIIEVNSFPVKHIDYEDCAGAMTKMWMDNVVTDGEYNKIMNKLNKKWGKV